MNRDNCNYQETEPETIDSDYEMPTCEECGEKFEEDDLYNGLCGKCFREISE